MCSGQTRLICCRAGFVASFLRNKYDFPGGFACFKELVNLGRLAQRIFRDFEFQFTFAKGGDTVLVSAAGGPLGTSPFNWQVLSLSHQAMRYRPPSTTIACPVINAASSLVRNEIAPVMSLGSPSRLIACCSHVERFCSSD